MDPNQINFVLQHKKGYLSQSSLIEELPTRYPGTKVTFVDWVEGKTTYIAPKVMAFRIRKWLFRTIVEWEGKHVKFSDPKLNRVRRMELDPTTLMTLSQNLVPTAITQKYNWMCMACGRVWRLRTDAKNCKHEDTVIKRGKEYKCIRQEKV